MPSQWTLPASWQWPSSLTLPDSWSRPGQWTWLTSWELPSLPTQWEFASVKALLARLGWPAAGADPADTVPAVAVDGPTVQTQFSGCRQLFPGEQPPIVPASQGLRELCFSGFAVLHSGQTKTPVFTVERLSRIRLKQAQGLERTDRFYAEARLPKAERAELEDYKGSGYSRGHMAPAADMYTPDMMAQSFSLANMVPQNQSQNAGAWKRIEEDTRKYVMRAQGDVYVFTGPVYASPVQHIGEGVAVPAYLYKAVYDATTRRSWVYWQVNSADAKAGPPIGYDELVKRVGIQFLPRSP